ncbi:hypothetical protein MtrunA17_Chr6g0470871 [Medicago truncatula]|uniref:Uncharacterized protein n=1 Tax=Medicago truncatula TaxID=3880 RepID=A0A396HE73_MEDTR|nr:hypothetical protein MtrunA17_Chr6g0470871 [Medicago truncatula]
MMQGISMQREEIMCCTDGLIEINKDLSAAHKSNIMELSFRYLLDMKTPIKMNGNVLRELWPSWDARSFGFLIA